MSGIQIEGDVIGQVAVRARSPNTGIRAGLIVSAVLTSPGFVAHPAVDPDEMVSTAWQISHLILWVGGAAGVVGVGSRPRR